MFNALAVISVVDPAIPQGTLGQPYNASIQATGGTSPYMHVVNGGALPLGISLSPAGVFSGTPQTAGQFSFAVQTTDATSATAVTNISLRINGSSNLVISPVTLPAGQIGNAFDYSFASTGGTSPYSYDIVLGSGAAPAGLTLSSAGRLSGTPTAGGVFPFTVRVTDAGGNSYQTSTSLRVDAATLTISTTSLAGATANVPYTQTIAAIGGTPPYSFGLLSGTLPPGLTVSTTGVISGTPTSSGTFNFFIRVTDAPSMAAQASFSIVVTGGSPVIAAPTLPNGVLNQPFSAALLAQGGTAPYTFSVVTGSLPPGITLSPSGSFSGTPNATGVFPVTVRVSDAGGLNSQRDIFLNVNSSSFAIGGLPPDGFTTSVYNFPVTVTGGTQPVIFSLASGTLPPGLALGTNGAITGTATTAGTYSFVVRGIDAVGSTAQAALTIRIQSSSLVISQGGLANAQVGQAYSSTITATNGAPPYSFTLISGVLPPGLTLGSNGNVFGTPTTSGVYQATIRVTDANSATAQATINLFVNSTGLNITTIVLPSARATQGYLATLTASGGTLPYSFQLSSGTLPAGLTLSPSGQISGTPATVGSSSFTVRVTDGASATAEAAYTFNVNAATGVVVTPATLTNAQNGRAYSTLLTPTGGTAPYTFTVDSGSLPPGITLSSTGTLSGTPTALGTYVFTYRVTDAVNGTSLFTQSLAVTSSDLSFVQTQVPNVAIGVEYFTAFTGSGGTSPYTYSLVSGTLPPGLTLGAGGTVSGTTTSTGSYPVTLRITDANGSSATANFTFTVGGSGNLSITTTALPTARSNQQYTASLLASGGRPPYIFTIASGTLPAGLSLSNSGVISGFATTDGASTFVVRVTDQNGTAVQTNFTLTVTSSNLTIVTDALPNGQAGQQYSSNLAVSGGTGPYSYSVVGGALPAGLTLSTTGTLSGAPTLSGIFPVVIRVVDAAGATFQRAFTLLVGSTGLGITNASLPQPYVGQPYLGTLTASGGTAPYVFSIASGALPSGLTLASNGQISGNPETVSQAVVTFRVVDATQATATTTLTLLPIQSNLNFLTTSLPGGVLGQSYSFTVNATGGSGTYTISPVNPLPAGLTLTSGVLSGTPLQEGVFNVTLRAQDTLGSAVQANFALTITGSGFRITNLTLPAARVNQAFSQTIPTAGGTGAVTFSLQSGSLPAGLSLSSAGLLSGTPTSTGSSTFTVRATDANQAIATAQYTLQVSTATVSFTTATLPTGAINTAYNQNLAVSGGSAPYTFTLASGALPTGLTLSSGGAINGSPTAAGSFNFSVRAADSTGASATANFLIGIGAVGAPGVAAITSAANYVGNAVSPGEVVTIFGSNLGPVNLLTFTVVNNSVGTVLGGTRVLFDGVAAPVIYTSANQVAAVAPFGIAGRASVQVVVEYQGSASATLLLPVVSAKPALFTLNSSGTGAGAIVNQDGTVNTQANPARRGTIVSFYLTGAGLNSPVAVDGRIVTTMANLAATATVSINNQAAVVSYAGNAPGLIPGVAQINAALPAAVVSGANPIRVTIGGIDTTSTVTVFVE